MVPPARRHGRERELLPTVSWGAAPAGTHGGGNGSSSHGGGGARRKNGGGSATSAATASQTAAVLGFDFKTSLAGEGFVPAGIRQWLKYDAQGRMTVIPADKRPLIEELHLPFRDAVMVNPLVPTPYPPTIFIRDAALVLNLGSLRACVGADRVFLLSVPDDSSEHWAFPDPNGRFERELAARLAGTSPASAGDAPTGAAAPLSAPAVSSGADLLAAGASLASPPPPPGALPFELRALEACLAEALSDLSAEAALIADSTLPALESLADGAAVTRRGLEIVRGAKLSIKRLEARINGVKRELSEIIDDDDDLRDMLLTHRKALAEGLVAETAAAAAPATAAEGSEEEEESGGEAAQPRPARLSSLPSSLASDERRRSLSPAASTLRRRTPGGVALAGPLERLASAGWAPVPLGPGVLDGGGSPRGADAAALIVVRAASHHDIAACESMLESYFMQADFLLSRLFVLKERIDDTEDFVGIELDTRRNELVALQLLVTLATAALAVISTVGSLLGMNLAPLPIETSVRPFFWITGGSLAGGAALFIFTLYYARSRRILWIPKVPRD